MKRLKSIFLVGSAVCAVLLSGCNSFDYVGQKLEPIKGGEAVVFYNKPEEVPPNIYKVLGRAVITAPDGSNTEEVRQELLEKARAYGANAVEIILFKRIKTGTIFYPKEAPYQDRVGSWAVSSNRADGSPIFIDTFVKTVPLKTGEIDQYEIKVKALFLAKKERLKKSIEEFNKERESYLHGSSRFSQ